MNPNPESNLPFAAGAIDWLVGVECKADQLREVMTKAEQAGFKANRVQLTGARYRVEFEQLRQPTPERIFTR